THDLPLFTPLPVAQIPRVFRLSLCACPVGSGSSDCRYFAAEEMAGNPALLASQISWSKVLRRAEPWDIQLNAWDQSESATPSKHASTQNSSPGHIFWVFPAYKVEYLKNVKPLTPREKFNQWARAAYDPLGLGTGAVEALIEHSPRDGFCGYGNGWGGYGKCFGSAELDANISSFLGDYLFPVLLRQDPRYFGMGSGSGSVGKRFLYAVSRVFITRTDAGHTAVDYSALSGTILAAAASNLYYPAQDRGFGHSLTRVGWDLGDTAIFNLAAEFWPDINRKLHEAF
ncbi:MAG: hypothetical protein ACRD1J_12885, partial [Terriglobia bacterium]